MPTDTENASQVTPGSVDQTFVAEADAIVNAFKNAMALAEASGAMTREELARRLGRSANKFGRPERLAFLAFVTSAFDCETPEKLKLARLANRTHSGLNDGRKDVVKMTAGRDGMGRDTWSMIVNRPVDLEGKW